MMRFRPYRPLLVVLFLLGSTAFAQKRAELPVDGQWILASRDSAVSQEGVTEKTGNNDGIVLKYGKTLGYNYPIYYCAAGQYWAWYVSGFPLGYTKADIPLKATALASDMFNDGYRRGIKTPFAPKEHDLIFWRKVKSINGHVERIIKVNKAGWVETIGYNTGPERGSGLIDERNGGGVFIRKRNIKYPLGRMQISGLLGFRSIVRKTVEPVPDKKPSGSTTFGMSPTLSSSL